MHYTASELERTFSTLQLGLSTFVLNAFNESENGIKQALDEIEKLRTENQQLKEKLAKYEPEVKKNE